MALRQSDPLRILIIDDEEATTDTFLRPLLEDPALHVNVAQTHAAAEKLLQGTGKNEAGPWFHMGLVNASSDLRPPTIESFKGPIAFALALRERVKRKWGIGPRASPAVYTYSHLYRGQEGVRQLRSFMEGVFTDVIDVDQVRAAVRLELEAHNKPAFAEALQKLSALQHEKREQVEHLLNALGEEFRAIYLSLFPHRKAQWGLSCVWYTISITAN